MGFPDGHRLGRCPRDILHRDVDSVLNMLREMVAVELREEWAKMMLEPEARSAGPGPVTLPGTMNPVGRGNPRPESKGREG